VTGGWASFRRRVVDYGGAAGLSVLLAVSLLRLWEADLRVPFDYGGDATFFGMVIKSVVEDGWYLTNAHLSAPFVLELHDFPIFEVFHLALVKVMALFSHDWALLFNLYFLLGFPLITMSALAVFRHFRVAYAPALAGALLYAFAARRLYTGESHYFLDIFYQVPLGILVALWVSGESPPLVRARGEGRWPRITVRGDRGRSLAALVICVLVATTGIYYAVFTGFLIFFGGLVASLDRRTWRNALAGLLLSGSIVATLGLQGVPSVVYQRRQGPNPQVAARQPQESEIFGLRIARLLLPVNLHRVAPLRRLKERSDHASAVQPSESTSIGLGVVASVGFLGLLTVAIRRRRRADGRAELMGELSVLNLLAVLLSTTGGFGYLFALLVTPEIRGYSRMSVIIAFLALFAVVVFLDRVFDQRKRLGGALAAAVAMLGLLDQAAPAAVRPYAAVKQAYARDKAFVRGVEASVPGDAMILELPYHRFPEGGILPGLQVADYDNLRVYLHSRALRWSYPAVYNRTADDWIRNVSERPPAELLQSALDVGFAGIVIDRNAYEDGAAGLEAAFAAQLGAPAVDSADGRMAFFNLTARDKQASANLTPSERERRRRTALEIVSLRWMEGFFGAESGPNGTFHWSSGDGAVQLENPSGAPLTATIKMAVFAATPPASLEIHGDLLSEHVVLRTAGAPLSWTVTVPPGRHLLHFHSDGAPAEAPLDARRLVWFAQNASVETLQPPLPSR
jgi:phosphoglycerol transferase